MGEIDGVAVASAFRAAVAKGIFFGSYYYVKKEYRKRGFGTRLRDQVAREHVGNNILVVDATDDSKTANETKFGYIKAPFEIVRVSGPSHIEVFPRSCNRLLLPVYFHLLTLYVNKKTVEK